MREATYRCLRSLREKQTIPRSSISRSVLAEMQPLFASGVLRTCRRGAGEAVQVVQPKALNQFITVHFPEANQDIALPSRATAVRTHRNSKQARGREAAVLLMRALRPLSCQVNQKTIDAYALTQCCGVVAMTIDPSRTLTIQARIALVENLTCFLHAERMPIEANAVFYTAGRLSEIVLQQLAAPSMQGCTYLHCPDYDPVGLTEYLRYRRRLQDRIELFIPDNLQELLKKYGKPELLAGRNAEMLQGLRASAPRELRHILQWIDEANAGLEQEILIV